MSFLGVYVTKSNILYKHVIDKSQFANMLMSYNIFSLKIERIMEKCKLNSNFYHVVYRCATIGCVGPSGIEVRLSKVSSH